MTKQLRTQADIDPIGRVRKEIGAEAAQRVVEDGQRDHANRQHVQRRETLVHQNLVDHHLCEERCQQGKQLQKERSDEDFAEKLAVFDDGRNKPGEIELQVLRTQVRPLRKQQQLAGPLRFKLLTGEYEWTPFHRILNERLLAVDLGEHDISAIP